MEQKKKSLPVDRELDIKGEVCPYTFVRSKLALEEMDPGQVLRVVVDHEPATENVPKSMTNEGHDVLEIGKVNKTDWEIIVRKK